MDSNFNKSTPDVPPPPIAPSGKMSMVTSSSYISNVASTSTNQAAAPGSNTIKKHIIRKIIPIDPKKLQQAGLGRKIVEVLSKQKSQQASSSSNQSVGAVPTKSFNTQTATTRSLSFSQPVPAPAKQNDNKEVFNKLKPPIITITGPEALTELEKQNFATLNPLQRLVHVKNLLNKKIKQKKSEEMNDDINTNQLLKPPQAIGDRGQQQKIPTKVSNEKDASKGRYAVLKEPAGGQTQTKIPTKLPNEFDHTGKSINIQTFPIRSKITKAPLKSPQDIARKLDFQKGTPTQVSHHNEQEGNITKRVIMETVTTHPDDEEFRDGLNKITDVIPKASITSATAQKPNKKPRQPTKKLQQIEERLPFANKTKGVQDFQSVYLKQQGCLKVPNPPKTQTKSQKLDLIIHNSDENTQRMDTETTEIQPTTLITALPAESPLPIQQKLDITEVSPLKVAFPTANVSQDTPLPTIDSFKKPYPLVNTNYYNLQPNICNPNDYVHTNYETSLFNQQPTTSAQVNVNRPASTTNSLVVLENKILSQDEMIDLTELRLSSKTPRFIHPHRPIPEVVIKQENPDEYQATETPLTSILLGKKTHVIQNQSNEKQPSANLPLTNKQKKIIINAQKLKLPPEQLADLARRIKQTTASKKTTMQNIKNAQVVCDTKFTQETIPTVTCILAHPTEIISPAPNVKPENDILPLTQVYGTMYYPNQDYYVGQNYFVPRPTNFQTMNPSFIEINMQAPSEVTKTYNYYENPQTNYVMTDNSLASMDYTKSAVEIVDEPLETEDCFSAVDFIAALGNTSNELSPEELNLNASCSFNQNYTPKQEISSSPQKVSTPKIKTNAGENLLKSTIVIESSKGQETILTNDSPDKNELEKVKEKIKIYHEMNKQKLGKSTFKPKSPTKIQHVKYAGDNSQAPPINQMASVINYAPNESKLNDNINVCDMDVEETSHEQQIYIPEKQRSQSSRNDDGKFSNNQTQRAVTVTVAASPERQEILLKAPFITKTTMDASPIEKSDSVIESALKPSLIIDTANNDKEVSQRFETPKTAVSNICDLLENIVPAREQTNNENLEIHALQSIKKEAEKTEMLTPNNEVSDEINATTKLAEENENPKSNETNTTATIATKRISKFKKGKINLVPRNKSIKGDRKREGEANNKDAEKSIENKEYNKEEYLKPDNQPLKVEEKVIDNITKEAKPLKCKKTLETEQNATEEVIIINSLTTKTNTEELQNTGTNKDFPSSELTPHSDKQTHEEADKNAKFEEPQVIPTQETLSQGPAVESHENRKAILQSEKANNNFRTDITEVPKASIKTTKGTTKTKTTKTSSCKETTEIPKASIKTSTSSPKEPLKDISQRKIAQNLLEVTENLIKQRENFQTKASSLAKIEGINAEEIPNTMETSMSLENTELKESTKEVSVKESQIETNTNIVNISNASQSNESTQSTNSEFERKQEERTQETILEHSLDVQNIIDKAEKSSQIETIAIKENSTEKFKRHSLPKSIIECSELLQGPKEIENLKVSAEDPDSVAERQCNISLNAANIDKEKVQEILFLPIDPNSEMKQTQQPKKATNERENSSVTHEMLQLTEITPLNPIDVGTTKPLTGSEDDLNDLDKNKSKRGMTKDPKKLSERGPQYSRKSLEHEQLPNDNDKDQKSETLENLNQKSQTILQTMKSARVSLIDIVKHSPAEPVNKAPILPFKKAPNDTKKNESKVFGIMTLLNQFKDQEKNNEPAQKLLETEKPMKETMKKETKKGLAKKEEPKASRCSLRSCSKTSEVIPPLPPKITRKRLSTRPLISDDDLEFLPENAEIKFNFAKTKQKDANKKTITETVASAPIQNRRESLYASTHSKRTRFYSQTLETNVTITFDNLKNETNIYKSVQNMEVEESCLEKTHDSIISKPIKQRKKLRKTLEDIKKSQKVVSDTDSEDDQRDNDCLLRDCEESNEFLGFEETSESNSPDAPKHIVNATEHESKTKHGGLKNWLTTGKAISPTFDKAASRRRLRHDDVSPVASTSLSCTVLTDTKQKILPRKRWDLSSNNAYEETDITDDTSPADDEEEEISRQISNNKIFKRGVKNVIDSYKNAIANKKINLDEQSFIKSHANLKNSVSDTECSEEKAEKTRKQELNKTKMEDGIARATKLSDVAENMEQNFTRTTECNQREVEEPPLVDKYTNITEKSVLESVIEEEKLTATKMASKKPLKESKELYNDEGMVKNESQTSQQCQEKHFETGVTYSKCQKLQDENKSCASSNVCQQMEPEHHIDPETFKYDDNQKSKEGEKESSTLLQDQETPSKPENLRTTNKRKRSTSTSTPLMNSNLNDSDKIESPLVSNKKRNIRNDDDHASQSLLEPTKVLNISPTQNLHIEDCDSSSLLTPLFITAERDNSKIKEKPKGKIGRPRKLKTEISDISSTQSENAEECDNKTLLTALINNTQDESKTKRGRKRKSNILPILNLGIEEHNSNSLNTTQEADSSICDRKPKGKRGRKPKTAISNTLPNSGDTNSLSTPLKKALEADNPDSEKKPTVRRGKKVDYTESNFNSRLLLITRRDQLDSDEILTETDSGSGSIQCGLCLARTEPPNWLTHLILHYGVGWKAGEERPPIENRSFVCSTIINFLKQNEGTSLTCRMCGKVFRSALGVLFHIEQCGHQERVNCEFCQNNYSKLSLPVHLRTCRVRFEIENQKNYSDNQDKKFAKEIVGNSGRFKRYSTLKAENKLKVLGKELQNFTETEKPDVNPKFHIKYVPPLEMDFKAKWSYEIENLGQASCPHEICKFTSSDFNELNAHLEQCKRLKSGYICTFCRQAFKSEQEAIDHIKANHQKGRRKSNDSDCDVKTDYESATDEDADFSDGVEEVESTDISSQEELDTDLEEQSTSKKEKCKYNLTTLRYYRSSLNENRKKVFDGRYNDINKEVSKKWNKFTKSNYSCNPLYNEFKPQFAILKHEDYKRYLPSQTVSMKFNLSHKIQLNETVGLPEKGIEWTELNRFETINKKTQTYLFLGAPIKFCSWAPLPSDVNEQYLAVVYRQEMFKFIKAKQSKHHSVILLFKVTLKNKVPQLSVHYGFVVNDGPINHLSFLPSGGYDASANRLGLVAVATVTSCIKIYSFPLNIDLAATSDNSEGCIIIENIKLIDIEPSFMLNFEAPHPEYEDKEQNIVLNTQCLQICWSEFSGHQHIFAGFSNGFLGIWNINNNSHENLNRFVINDIVNYVPINYFYLGEKNVKCIVLHYDTLGPRWLAAATAVRKLVLFDIRNLMNPIIQKEEVLKNILLAIDWCPIWETFLYSYDDILPHTGNGVLAYNPTNVMFLHNKLDNTFNGVTQAHYTPLTNMCVTALNNGEIVFLDTKELHYDNCLSTKPYSRRAFYAMDVKQLNGEPFTRLPKGKKQNEDTDIPSDWKMYDHDYKEKFGLVFTPLLKLDEKLKKFYTKITPPPNVIPYMRINTLRCNLNQNGKNLIAAGYENGFLRLLYFNKDNVFRHSTIMQFKNDKQTVMEQAGALS